MSAQCKSQWLLGIVLVLSLTSLIPDVNAGVTDVCPILFTTASLLSCPFNRDPVCNLVYYLLLIDRCISYSVQGNGQLVWPNMDQGVQSLLSAPDSSKEDARDLDQTAVDPEENKEFLKYIM